MKNKYLFNPYLNKKGKKQNLNNASQPKNLRKNSFGIPIAILTTVLLFLAGDFVLRRCTSTGKGKTDKKVTLEDTTKNEGKDILLDDKGDKEKSKTDTTFRLQQVRYKRVRDAYSLKRDSLKTLLASQGLDTSKYELFIRAFKREQIVEVWARNQNTVKFKFLKSYAFCKSSGTLGPKRKEGDKQIPEGFYHIDRFNPASSFHLSLGINYPNKADDILGDTLKGKDIYIHGGCETVGCIPITNDNIKELYILSVDARSEGQKKIAVNIFPAKLSDDNFKKLQEEYKDNKKLLDFWKSLKKGYDYFEKCKELPTIKINNRGYVITDRCK